MRQTELISKKTRLEFREHFVGWTLRAIADEFDAADIECDLTYDPELTGERRTLVEQYYHTLDFANPHDIKKLLNVYGEVLHQIELELQIEEDGSYWSKNKERLAGARKELGKLTNLLKRDGWVYEAGAISPASGNRSLSGLIQHVTDFDLHYIRQQIERIEVSVVTDPSHAIGTAKELVESTCKTILKDEGVDFDKNIDLMPLVKKAVKQLELAPEDIPDSKKGAESIKKVLHQLTAIVHHMGELRGRYGSGHGKDGRFKGLQPRHAKLVAGMAGTLVLFLFETHLERSKEEREDND